MRSTMIRGGLAAAGLAIVVLSYGFARPLNAQQAVITPDLAAKGAWDAGTTYAKDDIVTARGSSWISLRANNLNKVPGQTQPSSAAYWRLFARGFNPAGAWSNVTKYQPDDLVTFGGQTYRAKLTNTNKATTNTTNWELLAAKGAAGPNTGIGNGTQSVPSISFTGDPDTGIFHPGANKIALVESGVLFLHNLGSQNAALGLAALGSNTSGIRNTALGETALASNTVGHDNTALGQSALVLNTSGNGNFAAGPSAMHDNTTGSFNVALGAAALLSNTTGQNNIAVGLTAMNSNTTGATNLALGNNALYGNVTGSGNIAIGDSALHNSDGVDNNVAIGVQALSQNSSGASNTAIGHIALKANTNGSNNTAVGKEALSLSSTGSYNTAIGDASLGSNSTGGSNTAVGETSLYGMAFGERNTAVGRASLGSFSSGNDNIAIGYAAAFSLDTTANNTIFIGNIGVSGDTNLIKIGTSQAKTFIAGIRGKTTGAADAVNVLIDSNGQLGTVNSSRRYKYDIATMADASAMLGKLRPVTFRYKQAQNGGAYPLQYGLIAEEVADIFPDLAVFKDGQPETVKYHLLPTFLLAGYQAQQKTIAALRDEVRQQKEMNASLEARLARIEAALPQTKAASLRH